MCNKNRKYSLILGDENSNNVIVLIELNGIIIEKQREFANGEHQ